MTSADWPFPGEPCVLEGGPGAGHTVGHLLPDTQAPREWVYTDWIPGEGFVAWIYGLHHRDPDTLWIVYRYSGHRVIPDPRLEETDGGS